MSAQSRPYGFIDRVLAVGIGEGRQVEVAGRRRCEHGLASLVTRAHHMLRQAQKKECG